ncbi:MAG: hypothetical protein KAJ21_04800, partial [Thermoplasmatales archaeon]|nr:hypothetical protein [Thermoplasmatales archaeon]
ITISFCLTALHVSAFSEDDKSSNYKIIKLDNNHTKRIVKNSNDLETHNKILNLNTNIQTNNVNIPVLSTEFNCQNPSISTNGNNILVIAEESMNLLNTDVIMAYSSDNGDSWSDIFGWTSDDTFEEKPVIDFCNNNEFQAYGTCLPDLITQTLNLYHFPSMIDPEISFKDSDGWTVWSTTLSNFNDFYAIDIAGYPHGDDAPAPDFHGIITLIGSSDYGETIENYYETENMGIGACYLDFDGELGDTISVDIDLSTKTYFEAFELKSDEEIEIEDGVFFEYCWVEPGNEDWWENDWPAFVFEGAQNPDLIAENGRCFIVCEVENEIICFYSFDNGENFDSSIVNTDGESPSISVVGDTVICTFIQDNNLYTTISEDGGISWDEITKINEVDGSVIVGDSSIDLSGNNLVWTDDRSGDNVVYFGKVGEISAPIIEIESITGGMGVTTIIKNIGTADAQDIDWSISFDGGTFFGGDNSGTIDTLAVGESVTVKSKFLIGLGSSDITINVDSITETKSGTVFLFFVIGL